MVILMKKYTWNNLWALFIPHFPIVFVVLRSHFMGWNTLLELGFKDLAHLSYLKLSYATKWILPCLFIIINLFSLFSFSVDHMLVTILLLIHGFSATLSTHFTMKDLSDLDHFLEVQVVRTSHGLFLSQHKYTSDLLKKFHFHTLKSICTLCVSRTALSLTNGELLVDPSDYHCMVGALQYLIMTRPDIAYVHTCGFLTYACSPYISLECHQAYLQVSARNNKSCFFNANSWLDIMVAFYDSDWIGYPDNSHLTTTFAVFLGSSLIFWRSKKQPTISCFSTKVKHRAIAYTTTEIQWLCQLLFDLGIFIQVSIRFFCDNISVTYLAANLFLHNRSKYIKVDLHFFRDMVTKRHL